MAQHVFLSYSSHDKATAETVCAALEAGGIPVWMAPRNILPGTDYGASIIEALEEAQAIVLVFSSHSNASPHIKREVERAVNKGIAIIPLRIEDVMPSKSLEYFISTQHWLDAFTPPLERHLKHLVETMRVLLGREDFPPSTPTGTPHLQPPSPSMAPVTAPPTSEAMSSSHTAAPLPTPKTKLPAFAVPIVVGVIILVALAAGLFWWKSRPAAVPGPKPAPIAQDLPAKTPELSAAVKYNLERAKTAPRPQEKINWLTKALEQQPQLAEAYNDRGIVYAQMGQVDQALKDFDAAISLNPKYAKAYNNRGNLYQKRTEQDKALEDYNKALALNANYAPAYVNRGNVYLKKGQTDKALEDYSKAIALKPDDAAPYLNRGLLLESRQEYARALEDFQQAIKLKPDGAAAHHGRGYHFLNQGDYDRALADLNQALTLDPGNALAYRHRGQTYLKKGDKAQAQSDFQQAQSLESQTAK